MTARLWLQCLVIVGASLAGCASHLSVGRDYGAAGKHELATLYVATHYRAHGGEEDAKAELVTQIENALRSLDADYETRAERGEAYAALGIATRKEAVLSLARTSGLREFDAVDGGRLVREALPMAAKQALKRVDQAESEGRPKRERVALLRQALAFTPNDGELAARYDRLQSGLQLNVASRFECQPQFEEACRTFGGRLMTRVTEERREFTRIVPSDSAIRNAELIVRATVSTADTNWQRTKSGTARSKVEQKDRFKKTKKDSKGKTKYDKVKARYEIFQRTTQATVTVSVTVRDLRPPGSVLFRKDARDSPSKSRKYIVWDGDERALGGMASIGTDQSPPTEPDLLARTAFLRLGDSIAKQLLGKLEGTSK